MRVIQTWFGQQRLTGEMALAVVLLAGAGVMVRSFASLYTLNLGIDTSKSSSGGRTQTGMIRVGVFTAEMLSGRSARRRSAAAFAPELLLRLTPPHRLLPCQ